MIAAPWVLGSRQPSAVAGAVALAALLLSGAARADCNTDLGSLMAKRMTDIAALNKITKANGGKLDPITACPRLRSLAANEATVVAYMNKNKEWCSIPDDLVGKMTQSRARSAAFAVKACDFAVKIKKMQQQQAQAGAAQQQQQQQQQAIKLPAGPL